MQGNYCLSNDIFSLGITLLELSCNLELPTNEKLWQELRSSILPEAALSLLSMELQSVIKSMMEPDPNKRPTVNELLKTPKLKTLNYKRKVDKISRKCVSIFMLYICSQFKIHIFSTLDQNVHKWPPIHEELCPLHGFFRFKVLEIGKDETQQRFIDSITKHSSNQYSSLQRG